ncbi:hypothetical protein [Actinoplanes sp. M2I2]|uniref:hypothetical protein n=1 Tax=Actinoplanes sp. M2I2 TaxID=1734444 RepID=UPI00201FDD26|nr:hypothetical protein [Actinoplanes sp. M2I2]
MATTVHDVAILADFRFPDSRVAAEVRTQADAALSTVLVHAPLPGDRRPLPFGPDVRDLLRDGVAELARDDQRVNARLLVIRGRRPIVEDLPDVRAGRTVTVEDPDRRTGRSHLRWLAGFGVRPRISAPARTRVTGPVTAVPARRLMLVAGDPEAVARLTAIVPRLPGDLVAVIVTVASAATAVPAGLLTEHIPSRAVFRDRLAHLIALHRPGIVAVDGRPGGDLLAVVREHPGVVWVGMRPDPPDPAAFDHLLEPGEFAAATWLGGPAARHEDLGG